MYTLYLRLLASLGFDQFVETTCNRWMHDATTLRRYDAASKVLNRIQQKRFQAFIRQSSPA